MSARRHNRFLLPSRRKNHRLVISADAMYAATIPANAGKNWKGIVVKPNAPTSGVNGKTRAITATRLVAISRCRPGTPCRTDA